MRSWPRLRLTSPGPAAMLLLLALALPGRARALESAPLRIEVQIQQRGGQGEAVLLALPQRGCATAESVSAGGRLRVSVCHAGPPNALIQPTTTLRFDVTRERGHKEDFTRQRVSVEASLNNRAKVVLGRLRGASGDDAVWSARLMR